MSVINDLSTDQRVHKHCTLLTELGYEVLLIGRQLKSSSPLAKRNYATHRMKLPFEKGPWFYASYNIALFFNLFFRKTDLLFSNDLDTLLPNFLVSRIRMKRLIYDSHEYFTQVPELVNRPSVQRIWKRIESWILPQLKETITVNRSIASLYESDYGIEMHVLRNVPSVPTLSTSSSRSQLGLPADKKIVILQGSGINIDRGAEEAVEAMHAIDGAVLLILGAGDVIDVLKEKVNKESLTGKVLFKDRMPYAEMMAHTKVADLGLTLDKNTNINYQFSLPNKLFDYIHAGIPVLASDLKEVTAIIESYNVGEVIEEVTPKAIADKVNEMLGLSKVAEWKSNCAKASEELNWQKESEVLKNLILKGDG